MCAPKEGEWRRRRGWNLYGTLTFHPTLVIPPHFLSEDSREQGAICLVSGHSGRATALEGMAGLGGLDWSAFLRQSGPNGVLSGTFQGSPLEWLLLLTRLRLKEGVCQSMAQPYPGETRGVGEERGCVCWHTPMFF